MVHERGAVWWGPAPNKETPSYRPWLLLSDDDHPFADSECIAAAMTTQRHSAGIEVPDAAWIEGGSEKQAHVSPWYVATFRFDSFDRMQGRLDEDLVAEVAAELHGYTSGNA